MKILRKMADRLIGLSAIIGSLGLWFAVLVILVDVIGRLLHSPLFGAHDMTTMTFSIIIFGAMALCDRNGGHIVIDILEPTFPRAFNHFVDIFSALLGAAVFLLLAWTVFQSARLSVMLNLSSNLLNLPKAWFQWALCGFSVVTALGMVLRAAELSIGVRDTRRRELQE